MQALINRTVAGQSDNRIVLKNGQIKRKFVFGNDWAQLRIGILCALDATATIYGTPQLVLGLCNYGAGGFGSSPAGHVFGVRTTGTIITYTGGSPPVAMLTSEILKSFKRVGATVTDTASPPGSGFVLSAAPGDVRCALLLQITKGSPNFDIAMIGPSSATGARNNITDTQFSNAMIETVFSNIPGATGSFVGLNYVHRAMGAVAVDETIINGALDSFHAFWERTSSAFEIAHIRFRKIS